MAANLNNYNFKKSRADSFPVVVPAALVSALSVTVLCTGNNAVEFEFVNLTESGQIEPGEEKTFVSTGDPITDTINFTFNGAAEIEVSYVTGAGAIPVGGSASATNQLTLINRLDKKRGPGAIVDLDAPDQGSWPGFPLEIYSIKLVWSGGVPALGYENTYDLGGVEIENVNELAKVLNGRQSFLSFSENDTEKLLMQSNTLPVLGLIEMHLDTVDDLLEYVPGGGITADSGEVLTSNLDCIYETLKEVNASIRSLAQNGGVLIKKVTNPNLTFSGAFKSLTFVVPDVASSIVVTITNVNGGVQPAITYPITGTGLNIYGDTINFETFGGSKVTLVGTGDIYFKLISGSEIQ